MVQLHGNEKPDFISQIRDVKIIKAFSIDKNFNFNSTENYMKCDYFLFDTLRYQVQFSEKVAL